MTTVCSCAHQPIDEQMGDAERRRLLYVACTRAVDHLVVSLHRGAPTKNNADYDDWGPLTSAELLWAAGAAEPSSGARCRRAVRSVPSRSPRPIHHRLGRPTSDWPTNDDGCSPPHHVAPASPPPDCPRNSRRSTTATRRRPRARQATRQRRTAAVATRALRHEHRPCRARRAAVLRSRRRAPTSTTSPAPSARPRVSSASSDQVAALARSALAAPIVRSVVAGAEHWRELFVAAPVGDRVLEGYVDLLVRTPDGLVIVDYKTDQWSGPVQTAERVGRYRLQLAAYGCGARNSTRRTDRRRRPDPMLRRRASPSRSRSATGPPRSTRSTRRRR